MKETTYICHVCFVTALFKNDIIAIGLGAWTHTHEGWVCFDCVADMLDKATDIDPEERLDI